MASSTAKPEKNLGEFLKEQQEPFILELYLLERGYSKKWSSNGDSTKSSDKKRKPLLPFFKVLTALHKKLAFHNQSSSSTVIKKDSDTTNEHANVGVPHETVVETDRFSTASSSTMFNSCSDIDEDFTSLPSHKDNPLLPPHQSQQDTNNGKHRQRCLEVSVAHENETLNKDVSVWGIEQRIHSCGGVIVPKKITEDSLLSAALWSSLFQSHVLKSRKVKLQMHKRNQLLFDCVREITTNLQGKDCKQFMGPEKLGEIIWERTKEWSERGGNETNLTNLLNLDYLDSVNEWSEFKSQVKDIGVEIADAILDRVNSEIVSEMMVEILVPTV